MNYRVRLPFAEEAQGIFNTFSRNARVLFYILVGLCLISVVGLLYLLNASLLVAVPGHGGSLTEGVLGSPRFINPILAVSEADKTLTSLTFAGLLRATPDGTYTPDLAESYEVSVDGTVYTFVLTEGLTFHDGSPLTADDVLFTIEKTQDPALKSPLRANWDGVEVEKVDERTVRFTLKSPYAPFLENLTVGILPKARWQSVSDDEFPFSELNTNPVGAGPFKVTSIAHSSAGIPSSYSLAPFQQYALGEPYLSLTLRFFQSEDALAGALKSGSVESASGLSPQALKDLGNVRVEKAPLSRVFGVFFNQNQAAVLRDPDVREALDSSIDRQALVEKVLDGYGIPLKGPVPRLEGASVSAEGNLAAAAQQKLISKGWKLGDDGVLSKTTGKGSSAKTTTLIFTVSTGNVPELRAAAQFIEEAWTALGAKVDIQVYDQGDLSQNIIRPRKYDALLFGEVIGRGLDLFAFWHSSQRNDPGLNIALYANSTADSLLSALRSTGDAQKRQTLLAQFEAEVKKDTPAVFLYAPDFVYTVPNDLSGLSLGFISDPSDRFLTAAAWHREVEYVWPIFNSVKDK